MKRNDVLAGAAGLVSGARGNDYGDAKESFQRIADMWTAMKGVKFTAGDVGRFMVAVKLARLAVNPGLEDGYVDIAGYAALTGEIEVEDAEV